MKDICALFIQKGINVISSNFGSIYRYSILIVYNHVHLSGPYFENFENFNSPTSILFQLTKTITKAKGEKRKKYAKFYLSLTTVEKPSFVGLSHRWWLIT